MRRFTHKFWKIIAYFKVQLGEVVPIAGLIVIVFPYLNIYFKDYVLSMFAFVGGFVPSSAKVMS